MFDADALLALAKARYGEAQLRDRMRGAAGNASAADAELLAIAASVVSRVKNAAVQVGWPLPGRWPADSPNAGELFADAWPENLLQNALDLFNWRTLSGLEGASDSQRHVGQSAERFFDAVEKGGSALGVGGPTDTATPAPVAARNRAGDALIPGPADRSNVLDVFGKNSWGWDRFS
jgi:hypothetical protein